MSSRGLEGLDQAGKQVLNLPLKLGEAVMSWWGDGLKNVATGVSNVASRSFSDVEQVITNVMKTGQEMVTMPLENSADKAKKLLP